MASPVKAEDIDPLNLAGSLCEEELKHLRLRDQMREFLDWLLDANGDIEDTVLEGIADRLAPIGSIQMWGTSSPPSTKWLICNGQAVSRTAYASLFARIGTTFGAGDSSTTFNVPNFTDRSPIGAGSTYNLAATAGAATVDLVENNLPLHTHDITTRKTDDVNFGGGSLNRLQVFQIYNNGTNTVIPDGGAVSSATVESGSAGQSDPDGVSVVHPVLGVYFIIKAL